MSVIAVIFDFDDTLLPDSTSALLQAHGLDPNEFWSGQVKDLVSKGYDPPLAYLNLLLKQVGPERSLGPLTNQQLAEFGASLDRTWFPGLPRLFYDLHSIAAKHRDVSVEFYIISGGLQALIEGSRHVKKYFRGVYGCQLGEDPNTGLVSEVKRCVTFTEKTRFLFEVNKGVSPADAATQPNLVNEFVEEAKRPVPLRNMIYVGDGLTDIPCFSLVGNGGGLPLGVFQSGAASAKQAFQRLLATKRVQGMHHPEYRPRDELGSLLRMAVANKCSELSIRDQRAL